MPYLRLAREIGKFGVALVWLSGVAAANVVREALAAAQGGTPVSELLAHGDLLDLDAALDEWYG